MRSAPSQHDLAQRGVHEAQPGQDGAQQDGSISRERAMAIILEKKYLKGKCYWYACEKKRVQGKVKRVFQKYLGPQEQCLARLLGNDPSVRPPEVFKYGAVMALMNVAQELSLVDLIDHYMDQQSDKDIRFYHPTNPHLPSLGTYIVLAAINRCIASTSKRDMYHWFATTSLKRYWPHLTPHTLSSQCFWEAMQTFQAHHLSELTDSITDRVFQVYRDIDHSCLLFDQTNYYTFVDTFNQRNTLAQRGRNKQKRHNLRQVGYMLMVTKDGHIPVLYRCYQGHHNDITEFKMHLRDVIATAKRLTHGTDVTMVFDKGNVSKEVMTLLQQELYFVTSLVPSNHEDLLQESLDQMTCVRPKSKDHEEILAYVTTKSIWGKTHKIVIGYSPSFFKTQRQSLLKQIDKAETKLRELQKKLSKVDTQKTSRAAVIADMQTQIDKVLQHDNLKTLIPCHISGRKYLKLEFHLDDATLQDHIHLYFGKTIHITNQQQWDALEIIQTYRDQATIEACIKETKGMKHSLWWPMGHWTDQKIQVHGFYTFIALLLKSLVQKKLQAHGIHRSWHAVVSDLDTIYEVVDLVPDQGRLVPRMRLSHMNAQQEALCRVLL
jgi:transposase